MSHIGLVGRWDDRRKTAALVELRPSIDVHALARDGVFLAHAVTELRIPGLGGRDGGRVAAKLEAEKFWLGDQPILLRWHLHLPQRLWGCPACDRDCRHLFLDEGGRWVCRTCARLTYASRVTSPLPGLHRILSLRRAVGASPSPFGPLPIRRRRKQWQRLCEIRRLEQALLGAVRGDVIPVLESILDDGARRPRRDHEHAGGGVFDRQGGSRARPRRGRHPRGVEGDDR